MYKVLSIKLLPFILYTIYFILNTTPAHASNLINTSDTVSTSSPSAQATHTIKFKTVLAIPTSGKITLTFPALTAGDANNPASPSASTFQLNGLSDAEVKISSISGATTTFSGVYTNPSGAGSSPTIELTLTGTTTIPAGTTLTIFLGCSAASATTCTTKSPTIINPTKSVSSNADIWTIKVKTSNGTTTLDQTQLKIATNPSVQIQASIDPTLTFTISGIKNNAAVNTGNTVGCTNTEFTTTGIDSTATTVDLGRLTTTNINIASQLITVTTNALNGYSLTATSSGHLTNAQNGSFINDSTTPQPIQAGKPWFGIHACGLDAQTVWGTGPTGGETGAKYAWPTPITSLLLAKTIKGPVGNSVTSGNGMTTVQYASTIDNSIVSGTYSSTITYIVIPTF